MFYFSAILIFCLCICGNFCIKKWQVYTGNKETISNNGIINSAFANFWGVKTLRKVKIFFTKTLGAAGALAKFFRSKKHLEN